jgi:hypothetical protein
MTNPAHYALLQAAQSRSTTLSQGDLASQFIGNSDRRLSEENKVLNPEGRWQY